MIEPLYTIDDLAEMTGQSRRTIERRIQDGKIRVKRLSARCVRITESAVSDYLADADADENHGREAGSVIHLPTTQGGTA